MATTCPISRTNVKLYLRVDSSDEDDIIDEIMESVTEYFENFQQRTYISRTRYDYLDAFSNILRPSYSPLVSVTSIKYYDTAGVLQTLDAANYRVDAKTEPGRITEAYGCYWPNTRSITNAVVVEYISGYGATADDVPSDIKTNILQAIQFLYQRDGNIELLNQAEGMAWMRRLLTM